HRIVGRKALRILDVLSPLGVPAHRIDAQADDLDTAPVELGLDLRHIAELGGADRREVLGVREQPRPEIAEPFVKADFALGGLRFEIRCGLAELQCHCRSPYPWQTSPNCRCATTTARI